jgi:hypothetical protein
MGVTTFLMFRKKKDIKGITFHDGCFYSKDLNANWYFVQRMINPNAPIVRDNGGSDEVKDNNNNNNNIDPNTTRTLNEGEVEMTTPAQEEAKEKHVIVLNENKLEHRKSEVEIIVNNNFLNKTSDKNPDDKELTATKKTVTQMKFKGVTYIDYSKLTILNNEHDKRGFSSYMKDELIHNHSIVRIILKRSLIEPYYVNVVKLILKINLVFAANAACFTDNYIDDRANNPSRVIQY